MTDAEALLLVEKLLKMASQPGLNDLQSSTLQAVWVGDTYQTVADRLGYEVDYIKQIAARLWKQIAVLVGEDVSKRNIQSVLRRHQYVLSRSLRHAQADWGEAIDVSHFYGRQSDLQTLETWILSTRCRWVGIFGLGGIGKTTLSIKLAQILQPQFDCLIWRSLRQAPILADLLKDIVPRLGNSEEREASISTLMEQLHQQRCLLVLDNVESILQGGDRSGRYLAGYEDYRELLEGICDQPHQSCLILTGREKPGGIALREGKELPVRSLQLQGLPPAAAQQILIDKGLASTPTQYQTLVNYFGGNPLALKIAATTIQTLFGGDIQTYLTQGSTVFSTLWDLLEQQFQRLSPLQQQLMYWFSINREGITITKLQAEILPKQSLTQVLAALESLHQQSLIEATETGLTQQPVIMEYVTERLLKCLVQEVINNTLNLFCTHALMEAQTQDYLRDAQIQLIVSPLTERLIAHFGSQTALVDHLCTFLVDLRTARPDQTGYAGGNLINLFCYLKTDLKGFDFSHLSIRQAYLLNATLHETDFTQAQISQTVFAETFGGIVSVAYRPDGQRLATSDTRGDIHLWDAQTGTQLVRCRGHQNWTWAIAFSPDGQYLASASDDCHVKLWDAETGQCLHTYPGHTNSVNAIAFSPQGHLFASCSQDTTIRLWSVTPETHHFAVPILEGHQERVWAIAFSPDGQTLASGGEDCTIRLWNIATGHCDAVWLAHDGWVRALAFSPDGQCLASGSYDQTIKIWDIPTQTCQRILRGHRQPVTAIAYDPRSSAAEVQCLVSSSFDRTLKLWDAASGDCRKTFLGHSSRIWSVAYHPNSQQLVSGGDDHATKFWSLKTGRCTKTLVGHTNALLTLALSPDGQYLATGHEDQTIRLWDVRQGGIVQTLRDHTNRVWGVAFHPAPDRPLLASGSADYTLKLWDWRSGTCLQTLQGHRSWVWSIAFSPNGQYLVSSSYDHTLKLWEVASGKCLRTFEEHVSPVVSVAFSPCGQQFASSEFEGTIRLWNIESGECTCILTGHRERVWSVTFSPTGNTVLSASFDQTLKLWDTATGQCLQTFQGHQGPVTAACFSPDGQFVLSSSFDRSLKYWQISTGDCTQTLMGHTDPVFTLLLTPVYLKHAESATLTAFSGGMDESIKVWDIASQTCLATWRVPRPYEGMKIKGLQGLSEAQQMTLMALGAAA